MKICDTMHVVENIGTEVIKIKTKSEYDAQELKGSSCGYFVIPNSVISASDACDKRVAVFSYFSMRRGLDYGIMFTINSIVKWIGKKPNRHANGINAKIIDTVEYMKDEGYVSFDGNADNVSFIEATFNMQAVSDETRNDGYAVLYVDEVKKIMDYDGDGFSNNEAALLVFAYLRMVIPRRRNNLMPGETSIESRRIKSPEAYDCHLKSIAECLGISERMVSKSIEVLEELDLIRFLHRPKIKKNGKWITQTTIFSNFYKREKGYLLASGKEYYMAEIENKRKKIEMFS